MLRWERKALGGAAAAELIALFMVGQAGPHAIDGVARARRKGVAEGIEHNMEVAIVTGLVTRQAPVSPGIAQSIASGVLGLVGRLPVAL